jgi:hypothetical protein
MFSLLNWQDKKTDDDVGFLFYIQARIGKYRKFGMPLLQQQLAAMALC